MRDDDFDPAEFAASKPAPQEGFDPTEFAAAKQQPRSWSDVPGEALSNLLPSAGQFASNVAQPFIHPVQTAENIGRIGAGAMQKAGILRGEENIPYANAVGQFFADRYGGIENFKKTLATDPVGFAGDLSAVLSGGETALARVPGVVGDVAKAGTVSGAVDPLQNASRVAGLAKKVVAPGSADARALSDAGVNLTPAQITGGPLKTAEDALTSVPVLGSFIKVGRQQSVESFNKAVANQALDFIGEKLGKKTNAGHDLVDEVATKLGDRYDNIKPRLQWVPDLGYFNDLKQIEQRDIPMLRPEQVQQYRSIIDSRMGRQAPMNGEQFKLIEGELSEAASKFGQDPREFYLSKAINNTVMAMRHNLERSNPADAAELANINSGWAAYTRIRDAAARGTDGVFSPANFVAAVKKGDRSVGKGSFAKGDALMQAFAETAQRVLPSKLPSSGTSERAAHMAGLAGGAYLLSNPHILAAGAAAAAPYTRPGMSVLNKLYRARPTQYIPSGTGQTAFQLGRLQGIQPQKRGGAIKEALRVARRGRRGS